MEKAARMQRMNGINKFIDIYFLTFSVRYGHYLYLRCSSAVFSCQVQMAWHSDAATNILGWLWLFLSNGEKKIDEIRMWILIMGWVQFNICINWI